MTPQIITEDIFAKASLAYQRRVGADINKIDEPFRASLYRDELATLAEKILALRDVGAI